MTRTLNAQLYRHLHSSRPAASFPRAMSTCRADGNFSVFKKISERRWTPDALEMPPSQSAIHAHGTHRACVFDKHPAGRKITIRFCFYPLPEILRPGPNTLRCKAGSQPELTLAGPVLRSSFNATGCDTNDTKQKVGVEVSSDSRSSAWTCGLFAQSLLQRSTPPEITGDRPPETQLCFFTRPHSRGKNLTTARAIF